MTRSAFAADRLPGTNPPGIASTDAEYEPGVCNIGPAEIARRRRAGHVGLLADDRRAGRRRRDRCAAARPAHRRAARRRGRVRLSPGLAAVLRRVRVARRLQLRTGGRDPAGDWRPTPAPGTARGPTRSAWRASPSASSWPSWPFFSRCDDHRNATSSRTRAGIDRVERVAAALRSHNIEMIVVDTGRGGPRASSSA